MRRPRADREEKRVTHGRDMRNEDRLDPCNPNQRRLSVLGAGALSVGFIEGVAEATAQVAKLFSGAVSDWIGKRKLLVLLGYGLAALTATFD
jgi:hypothetical protein